MVDMSKLSRMDRRTLMSEYSFPINTAPRDGRYIHVLADDEGPYKMRWNSAGYNPMVSTRLGIWEAPGGTLTWEESSGAGPTHWIPIQ